VQKEKNKFGLKFVEFYNDNEDEWDKYFCSLIFSYNTLPVLGRRRYTISIVSYRFREACIIPIMSYVIKTTMENLMVIRVEVIAPETIGCKHLL
jgi:hypothetical protein